MDHLLFWSISRYLTRTSLGLIAFQHMLYSMQLLNIRDGGTWKRSLLTRAQFQKIDDWIFSAKNPSGKLNPLEANGYCVAARNVSQTKLEVLFSPNCHQLLCKIQPKFLELSMQEVLDLTETVESDRQFEFWFGDPNYFVKIFGQNFG